MNIEKNILIRPMLIKSIIKSVNSVSFHYVIWSTIPHINYSREK